MLDDRKAILFLRGERPILDDKFDLMHHPNIRQTEDGGAPPYNYAKTRLAANDLPADPGRYELYEFDD